MRVSSATLFLPRCLNELLVDIGPASRPRLRNSDGVLTELVIPPLAKKRPQSHVSYSLSTYIIIL